MLAFPSDAGCVTAASMIGARRVVGGANLGNEEVFACRLQHGDNRRMS